MSTVEKLDRLIADQLRAKLPRGAVIGRQIVVLEQTGSTNDAILQIASPQGAAVSSPPLSSDLEIASALANRQDRPRHDLAELFQRKRWQVFAKLLTFPPRARLAKLINRCKSIAIKHRAYVTRRFVREWVVCEQAIHFM